MQNGRILRIEKLSSFDGDGLRTVVFLKGCPLRCQWCSTPESQASATDFGVVRRKCGQCFTCVQTCPENAIHYNADIDRFVTDMARCSDCRQCVAECPNGARTAYGYTATVAEILKEIAKDSIFYYHSGGGVTISGGEPFVQADFLKDLLRGCLLQGINTAVETCGQAAWDHIAPVLPYIDTLFYDLKHLDDDAHRRLTGVGNRRILENLARIDAQQRPQRLIVRMPVIPGLNDGEENLRAVGEFCRKLTRVAEIQLLPYHRLGMETYNTLCRPYPLAQLASGSEDELRRKAAILEEIGLTARVGSF
ncbi:MAG: glycyl-radical enzyme activating protein [Desulfosarcinaceae bacterium]|nr:glycyl-radical enzyme activating protein [Desulfosarcinaceae bacterium]